MSRLPMIAFGLPGYSEMVVLLVLGVLIFGRRLPEVGRSIGNTLGQLRRGLDDFKSQMAADEDIREAKSAVHDLRRAVDAPRVLADPRRMMRDLTDETLATPAAEARSESDPPPSSEPGAG